MPEPRVIVHSDWDPLPDDAVVVRGGPLHDNQHLAEHAASVYRESNLRGICGGAAPLPTTADDVAFGMPYRGSLISESTAGALRAVGFDVVMVDDPPHCVILVDSDQPDAEWEGWERIREVFTNTHRFR